MKDSALLATDACDRATAYHMSNKVARHPSGVFVTWLDREYKAILAQIDPGNGEVVASFPLAQGFDNHCGAALAVTPDDRVHIVTGSHAAGGFIYRYSDTPADPASWSLPRSVGPAATYPSLIATPDGGLVLAHRNTVWGGRWGAMVHRRSPEGDWSWPLKLMHGAVDNYIFPTSSLLLGPDGTVHLILEFYKTFANAAEESKSQGVTHVYSPAGEIAWYHDDDRPVSVAPFGIEDAALIVKAPAGNPRPANPVVLPDGRVAVCVWDVRVQTLTLYVRQSPGEWQAIDLTADATAPRDGSQVCSHGRLALDVGGKLLVVTTIGPEAAWSHAEQQVCLLWLDPATSKVERTYLVPKEDPQRAAWLAAVEQGRPGAVEEPLILMYTDGTRGDGCVNAAQCNVRMLTVPTVG